MESNANIKVVGHVLIKDLLTHEVLVDKHNMINYENFSIGLARSISNRPDGWIQEMVFGNGAATVSGTGTITYLPPNVVGQSAQLYNQTYYKNINDMSPLNGSPTSNFMTVSHTSGTTYSDMIVTCTLDLAEPPGQDAFDTNTSISGTYVFNELGLKGYSSLGPNMGPLLTHVVFSPVAKTLNRQIEIVYTIRIQTA